VSFVLRSLAVLAICILASGQDTQAREVVSAPGIQSGAIVVKTSERRLYLGLGQGRAIRYPIAVGRAGKQWSGRTHVTRRVVDPVWQPPSAVKVAQPYLPDLVPPGPRNPLGPRALVLAAGEYAIHGTNDPSSIGRAVSWGCIRMRNADIVELFAHVRIGTPVIVMP
jgi:lipoprotein-anchoring transpeptidase ErfK/SrfK